MIDAIASLIVRKNGYVTVDEFNATQSDAVSFIKYLEKRGGKVC